MKAVQFEGFGTPEVLDFIDVPNPKPESGQVLIETTAIGVNFPDVRERLGVYNRAETRVGGVSLPRIPGLAVTGTVVAVGDQHAAHLLGRHVVALMKHGAYAQFAVAEAGLTVAVPAGTELFGLAGIAAQGVCAHLMLQASTRLCAGESLLVHGAAGGVGGLAVQIGKALGAGPVIGTASADRRRQRVLELGADAALDYSEPNWTSEVRRLTGGRGVDVLIESIGGDVFEQNFDALATFGRYLLLGSTRGPGEPFSPRRLMTKSQSLVGFYLPVFYDRPQLIAQALQFLVDGLRTGLLTATVEDVLPLGEAAEAHRRLEERRVRGVLVLDPAAPQPD